MSACGGVACGVGADVPAAWAVGVVSGVGERSEPVNRKLSAAEGAARCRRRSVFALRASWVMFGLAAFFLGAAVTFALDGAWDQVAGLVVSVGIIVASGFSLRMSAASFGKTASVWDGVAATERRRWVGYSKTL